LLTLSGLILKFFLPAGRGMGWRRGGYGSGMEGLVLGFGLARSQWREVHFWLAVLMLALLIVHVWRHRSWIRASLLKAVGERGEAGDERGERRQAGKGMVG
jgi:hypothetical protein